MKTNGWELSFKWKDQLSNGIRYDIGLVLSDYQSEVIKFSGNPNKLLSSLYDGMKMGEIWGYETVGILQESDFTVDENGKYTLIGPSQTKIQSTIYPGDVRYADLDGDGEITKGDETVDNPGDRKIIGNSTPRFHYGITGNISWKNFDLNIFFKVLPKEMSGLATTYFGVVQEQPETGKCTIIHGHPSTQMLNILCMPDVFHPYNRPVICSTEHTCV